MIRLVKVLLLAIGVLTVLHITGIYPLDLLVSDFLGLIWSLVAGVLDAIAQAVIDRINPF